MTIQLTRRSFIKGMAAATCTAAATALPVAAAGKTGDRKTLATLIDIRKCTGCESCVEACREVNAAKFPKPRLPFPKMVPDRAKPEDWSDQKDRTDRLTPYNWVFIQQADVTYQDEDYQLTLPRRCMHCENPPCVKLCPWGAAYQKDNGIAVIDSKLCLGGSKCKKVCPWQIPQRQSGVGLYLDLMPSMAGNGVMYKCDRCHERVAEGELPACIEFCPEGVQSIGPREEILQQARAIAEEIDGFIYGEDENGGTNTIYVSPVPFELIDQAAADEDLHLKPVEDRMADGNTLAKAMFLAPFAGAAAALLKFFHHTKSNS